LAFGLFLRGFRCGFLGVAALADAHDLDLHRRAAVRRGLLVFLDFGVRVVLPFLDVLLELFAHLLHARLQLFMHLLEALAHLLHGFAHFFGQLGGYFIFTPAADADSYAVFLDVFPVALFVRFLGLLAQAL